MDENKETNVSNDKVKPKPNHKGKDEENHQSKEISRYEAKAGISTLNLFDDKQLASAENFLGKVIKSGKGGITSVADGLAVLMRANDLGLPFSTCIEHIHIINGKTGVDIHIVKALLSKAGCSWVCNKDYQPLYEYTDGINVYVDGSFPEYVQRCKSQAEAETKANENPNGEIHYAYPVKWYKDFNGNLYKDYQLNVAKFGIAVNRQQAEEINKSGKIPVHRIPSVAIDYITEYTITRIRNGKETSATKSFSYSRALKAEMFEKDTYKKYPEVLIGHRAFTYAAREVASDILFGVSETTELKIVSGMELSSKDFDSVEEADVISLD